MAKLNNLTTISDEIFRELNIPSDTSIASIRYWVYTNIGKLNNLIYSSYSVDTDTWQISPQITIEAIDILKTLYKLHYYDKKVLDTLSGAVSNALLEVDSDGSRMKFTNKNEISKTYLQARSNLQTELKNLLNGYIKRQVEPVQVVGDDTVAAVDNSATNPWSIRN